MNANSSLPGVGLANKRNVEEAAPKRVHLTALDGLRFFAALSILVGHAWNSLMQFTDAPIVGSLGGVVSLFGMPLFFVLSGFVIHYNYCGLFAKMRLRWAALEFFGARFARLYPLFLASVFVGYAVQGIFLWLGHYDFAFWLLTLHNATLTQSWFYQIMFQRLMLYFGFGMGWSIATEWFFYIAFLGLVIPLGRQRNLRILITASIVYVVVIAVLLVSARSTINDFGLKYLHASADGPYSFVWWFYYFSPYVRVFEFILGCLTAQIYLILRDRSPSVREVKMASAVALACVGVLVTEAAIYLIKPKLPLVHGLNQLAENFGLATPMALIIFCTARYPIALARVLKSQPIVLLGERSYSIYAVHVLMIILFARQSPETISAATFSEALIRVFLVIVLTFILASATYRLIEIPGRTTLRKFFRRRMTATFGLESSNLNLGVHPPHTQLLLVMILCLTLGLCFWYQTQVIPQFGIID
jgi:peptidoglycan/LPS O-acetylase OafA/YrhL